MDHKHRTELQPLAARPRRHYPMLLIALIAAALGGTAVAADAQVEWQVCKEVAKETGKFTNIACTAEKAKSNFEWTVPGGLASAVAVTGRLFSANATLENVEKTMGITCTAVADAGFLWNRVHLGRDIHEIRLTNCKGIIGLEACSINEASKGEVVVEAASRLEEEKMKNYNKFFPVDGEPLAEIELNGAKCAFLGSFDVTGTARGEVAGNIQKFVAGEPTLEFLGKKSEFVAEVIQEGAASKEGIRAK